VTAVIRWATEPWPVRVLTGVAFSIVAGYGYAYLLSPADLRLQDNLRFAGLFLQVLGIGTIAWGLGSKGKLYSLPGAAERLREWLARFPGRRGEPIHVRIQGLSEGVSVSEEVTAVLGSGPDATVEQRLAVLEQNLNGVRAQVSTLHRLIRQEVSERRDADATERTSREQQVSEIQARLQNLSVGGIDIEWRGVLWVGLGVILGTAPQEIARLLQGIF
jgi:hypothetical protein